MQNESPIILAVDTTDLAKVGSLIEETRDFISIYKFGLEFYLRHGLTVLERIKSQTGIALFLDLKLHDIPNTVKQASSSITSLEPEILTVHAAGGSEMVQAATEALPKTKVAAVTVLTSLDQDSLRSMGLEVQVSDLTESLAAEAVRAGATALVASAHEVARLKERFPQTVMITPGIRLDASATDDQRRTMTPKQAMAAGSDYLVIGRPITGSPSPRESAAAIFESLR